jgi:hypothetical protein
MIYRISLKTVIKSSLVVVVLLLASPAAMACFCVTPEVSQGFEQARAVFQGEVLELISPRNSNKDAPFTDRAWTIRFKVERTWKGPFFIEADVFALMGDCFSPPWLVKGEKYLVYADPIVGSTRNTDVMIGACSRTVSLSATRTELRLFRPPLDQSAESDIRALNSLLIMPPSKPRLDLFPWMRMNFLEP